MFRNHKRQNRSASTVSCPESVIRKSNKSQGESKLFRSSKKNSKKNFLYFIQKKIHSVFDGKNKSSVPLNNSKALRSKSFEILSNSFEEADDGLKEDLACEKLKRNSKRLQPSRSKQTIGPLDYTIHINPTSSPARTTIKLDDAETFSIVDNAPENSDDLKEANHCQTNLQSYVENDSDLECVSTSWQGCKNDDTVKGGSISSDDGSSLANQECANTKTQILPNGSKYSDLSTQNLEELGLSSSYLQFGYEGSHSLAKEIRELQKYGWYWGPLNRFEAEEKLSDQPNGSFLVRDSSDEKYLLSLSFRSFGKTLHTRIEHSKGWFSFYSQPDHDRHRSLVGLINQCISESDEGIFFYSRPVTTGSPTIPVQLTRPLSRFMEVRSLQYLCRFVIRQYTNINHIQTLPLPTKIKGFLKEYYY